MRSRRARPIVLALARAEDPTVAALSSANLEVVVAPTCEAAIRTRAALRPDLVLVDLALADREDPELCARLHGAAVGAPILVLADPRDDEAPRRALAQGATDFVVAPIRAELLDHRIRLLVRCSESLAAMEDAMDAAARSQQLARYVHWKLDPEARTFRWSERADAVFDGIEGEGLLNDALLRWVHPNDRARVEVSLGEAGPHHLEYRLVLGRGEERVVHQASARALDVFTGRMCVTGTVHDVTELREAEAHADRLAYYDDLTDLPNRAHAERYLKAALATARTRGQRVGVLSLDLDLFRRVNDRLGHAGGDAVLREVARRLKTRVDDDGARRLAPMFARTGGNEFVVIVRDARGHEDVADLFRSLAATLGEPYVVEGTEVVVSCSAGIAISPENGRDVETLLRHAGAALHGAKASGRAGLQIFDVEVQRRLERKLRIEACLRAALASGESLELHYQPKVEAPSGRVVGVEALLRWRADADGPISPMELVTVAEETGLIQPLGDWVLRTACLQARAWSERGPRPIRVAVNVSARQFSAPGFEEKVAALLAETGIDPSLLELEITEGVMMFETAVTRRVLARLKGLGLKISLDDFGTGYSSLAYLTRFPIDCLKIDRSFIQEIGTAPTSETIVSAVIALARSLSIDIVAEGVETAAQRAFLERFGTLTIQGWLYSKALPPEIAAAWIVRHERSDSVCAGARAATADSTLAAPVTRSVPAGDATTGRYESRGPACRC